MATVFDLIQFILNFLPRFEECLRSIQFTSVDTKNIYFDNSFCRIGRQPSDPLNQECDNINDWRNGILMNHGFFFRYHRYLVMFISYDDPMEIENIFFCVSKTIYFFFTKKNYPKQTIKQTFLA